jgi:MFS family permease
VRTVCSSGGQGNLGREMQRLTMPCSCQYDRHRALAGGLALFAAGSLAAAFTQTTTELIAARAIMGIGGAFIMPATLSILMAVFTDHAERTRAIGLWSAVSGLGVAIGPVACGWLLTHFGWDSIFGVNLPIVAIALVAGHWLIPASRADGSGQLGTKRDDLTGWIRVLGWIRVRIGYRIHPVTPINPVIPSVDAARNAQAPPETEGDGTCGDRLSPSGNRSCSTRGRRG